MLNAKYDTLWIPVYEGEGDDAGDDGADAAAASAAADAAKGKTFTQDELNRVLAGEKRKHQTAITKMTEELTALQSRSDLTTEEREQMATRIEELNSSLLTKEEQAARELKKTKKQYDEQLTAAQDTSTVWRNRYTDSTIDIAIQNAALDPDTKAHSAEQILAMLKPSTKLTEVLSEDGKPTGGLKVVVSYNTVDDTGKSITLDLSPAEAVKRMFEEDKYANLFVSKGVGGLGEGGGSGGDGSGGYTQEQLVKMAREQPEKYRELRKSGKITI